MSRISIVQCSLITAAALFFCVTMSKRTFADCSFEPLPSSGFFIVCSDTIFKAITGTDQDDIIRLLPQANLTYHLTSSGDNSSVAIVTGVEASGGHDQISHDGTIEDLLARAETNAVGVSLTIDASFIGDVTGSAVSDTHASADAAAIGISGGSGDDTIDNYATLSADVAASVQAADVAVNMNISTDGTISGVSASDASVVANSTAIGIDGGKDNDLIDNRGDIALLSNADATGVAVSLDVAGTMKGDAEGSSVSDASVMATSTATGIDGGEGDDTIDNEGMITPRADANATAVSVILTVSGTMEGNVSGEALSDASATADAMAIGIEGGMGIDEITNRELIVGYVDSRATAVGVGLDIEITKEGNASGAALSDARVRANAAAIGIDGGENTDVIDNRGDIALLSNADAIGVAVSLDVAGSMKGDAEGSSVSDASVMATSTATGIDGGDGDDTIINDSVVIVTQVAAAATAVSVGLTVSGSMEGNASGVALSDGSASANAIATGIDGGLGIDTISNRANIVESVDASATTVGVGLNIEITKEGNTSGAALSDASVTADAAAIGIDGGGDADSIDNRGDISLLSNSDTTGVAVSLTVAGTMKGDAEGSSVSDASVTATSTATGIEGGEGDDTIDNDGIISLMNGTGDNETDASATAVSVSLTVSGSMEGNVAGEALSDSSASADATAIGIDGGSGLDEIVNRGAIVGNVDANATAVGIGANVSLIIAKEGDVEGNVSAAALSDASVTANATASGIDGGEGADTINNLGNISLSANSDSTGVSASLNVAGSVACKGGVEGEIAGKALSNTSTAANAAVTGIDGGADSDHIINTWNFSLLQARSSSIGVSATLDITAGIAVNGDAKVQVEGEAVSDSRVTAQSMALGLYGALGDDEIDNSGEIRLLSSSEATGVAATLNVSGALSYKGTTSADVSGSAASNSSVSAKAEATGIAGNWGADTIRNSGNITLMDENIFDADALGAAATLNISGNVAIKGVATGSVVGTAASLATVAAEAAAIGIDTGGDNDFIDNTGIIKLLPASNALGVSAALNISGNMVGESEGSAMSDATVIATSRATGINGGDGEDIIINAGAISLMQQGDGEDQIDATALGVAASLDITGNLNGSAEGQALSKSTTTAEATATGIDGGSGDDEIVNTAAIAADVDSEALGVAAALGISIGLNGSAEGAALSDASVTAEAVVSGIVGGEGADTIANETIDGVESSGDIELFATADAESVAVSVGITGTMRGSAAGKTIADSSATANTFAIGLDGGDGEDDITNMADIFASVDSYATAIGVSADVTVAVRGSAEGGAISDVSAEAFSVASGIYGAGENDAIINTGLLDIYSLSNSQTTAVSVSLTGTMGGVAEGKAASDGSATALSESIGIDGGQGDDLISSSMNKITTFSVAMTETTSVSVSGGGSIGLAKNASIANASSISEAQATGIDGGQGEDTIENSSEIEATVISAAKATATSVGVTIGVGSAETVGTGDSSATARADVTGIEGGGGDDEITNTKAIFVGGSETEESMASANAGATTVTVGLAVGLNTSEASSNAAAIAEANGTGISGGSGDDSINNSGTIIVGPNPLGADIMAEASARSTTVDISVTVGASLGKSASDTSSTAVLNLAGISGGSGDDTVYNSGAITIGTNPYEIATAAMATANAASETVDIDITVGGSFSDASSNASATAQSVSTGIETNTGNDRIIDNTGTLNVFSSSEAVGLGSTTTASLTLGASDGSAQSNASSLSIAIATGIDSGSDTDEISSDSDVVVRARAISTTLSESTNYNILSIGSALQSAEANSSSTAEAIARGIDGGSGVDTITVAGNYEISADTRVNSTSRSSTVTGLSIGYNVQEAQSKAGTVSNALAVGIDGGEGNDGINSTATLTVNTFSNANTIATSSSNTGFNIAGSSSGESVAGATSEVTASGVGIRGGIAVLNIDESDADTITNEGMITVTTTVTATTSSTSTADAITFIGAAKGTAISDASANVLAAGIGIDGGADNDTITNKNTITVNATADASVTSTSEVDSYATFGGASSMGVSDASANVLAEATGISGGTGDDKITSHALITVEAESIGTVSAISDIDAIVTFGGASSEAVSNASVTKKGNATGIDGGDGSDQITITSDGALYVRAIAAGTVTSDSHASSSSGFWGDASSITATAAALEGAVETAGIIAGGGADTITNLGRIDSIADATLFVENSSVATASCSFKGDSEARASSVSTLQGKAYSLGIGANDGDDFIENRGVINVSVIANTIVESATVAIADSFWGSEYTEAASSNFAAGESIAAGITTGTGDDEVLNSELVIVEAGSSVSIESNVYSSDGPASSDARTMALVQVSGIKSGADNDNVTNTGTVFVKAVPRIVSSTRTFGNSGNVDGKVGILLEASATGIAGDQGHDTISNGGDVLVYIGSPETDSTLSENSTHGVTTLIDNNRIGEDPETIIGKWIRITGGENPDFFSQIIAIETQSGQLTLSDALTYDLISGTTYTIYGYGDKEVDISDVAVTVGGRTKVDASTTALVQAKGIVGGDGDDTIINSGTIATSANNLIKAIQVTLGRNIAVDARVESSINAVGIEGNDQSCVTDVSNGETNFFTDLSRKGEDHEAMVGKTVLFKSGTSAGFITFIEAFDPETGAFTLSDPLPSGGLLKGDIYTIGGGNDTITNLGTLNVEANSAIDASSWSLDFGAANIEGQGQTLAASAGIRSGQFDDSLQNYGDISTRSAADVSSSDRVIVIFGRADQDLSFEASSYSVGVEMGDGNDDFSNAESGSISTESVSTAKVDGVTAVIFAQITNSVDAIADSTAVGLDLGQGNNVAYSMGDILTSSQATVVATAVSDFELGETDADADAIALSSATGILAENNENQIYSESLIQVNASTEATSFAQGSQVGNKDIVFEVTGGSTEDNNPSTFIDTSLIPQPGEQIEIVGEWVRFLSGENADENFFAQVVGFISEDIVDPDSGETLVPAGTVTLSMEIPHPVYAEEEDPDTGEIITVADEYTFSAARNGASASVATSNATGIDLQNSTAHVENTDILNVQAFAKATTTANTFGGTATAVAEARAVAQGIITGNENTVIINEGTITVDAEALTTTSGAGVTESISATATGITTGAGDDTIWNNGSIITMEKEGSLVTTGDAIVTGAGNDTVILGTLSTIVGDIDLGAGNDTLHLIGNPVVSGNILPDEDLNSTDSLIFEGEGSFANTLQGFDQATKLQGGTYSVTSLPALQRLEIIAGTLLINSNYSFAEEGLFLTHIYSDSIHSKLQVTGNAVPGGELQIFRSSGVYLNGTKYNILEAAAIDSESHFSSISVPEPSTLLSFEVHQLSDVVEVEVLAKSFTTVATEKAYLPIAQYLDEIMLTATGDLSEIIGEFQLLPADELGTAFSSLTPGTYKQSGQATLSAGGQYINTVHNHMNSFRRSASLTEEWRNKRESKRKPVLLAYNGSLLSLGSFLDPDDSAQRDTEFGIWIRGIGQWGKQDQKDGYLGYKYDTGGLLCGFDWALNHHLLGGFSLGYAYTDIQGESRTTSGDVKSTYLSAYGTYFTGKGYLETVISYGLQNYDNWRRIDIGDIDRQAFSGHDGYTFSAFLRSGYNFDRRPWVLSPYASLTYVALSEDAFTETGAGDINLMITGQNTDSLVAEIGTRFQRVFNIDFGALVPELSLAWNHDFVIDDSSITAGFTGAPGTTFSTEAAKTERNSIVLQTSISLLHKNGFTTQIQYAGKFRSSYSEHSILGELRYEF